MFGRRRRVGDFLLNLLQATTIGRYDAALQMFKAWLADHAVAWDLETEEDQDFLAAEYILDVRDEAELPVQHARDLISALQKLNPRRRLTVAWRVVAGWTAEHPPEQALPLPRLAALSAAVLLVADGRPELGVVVLLCWCGLLRVGEALQLLVQDLHFVDGTLVIFLAQTKRGAAERVVIANPGVVRFVAEYLRRYGGAPTDRLVRASYTTFRRYFIIALRALGIRDNYRSHSLRRGGATALFMAGVPLTTIMIIGRWASETSCRLYIRSGEVIVLRSEEAWTAPARARMVALAQVGPLVFNMVD